MPLVTILTRDDVFKVSRRTWPGDATDQLETVRGVHVPDRWHWRLFIGSLVFACVVDVSDLSCKPRATLLCFVVTVSI